MTVDRQILDNRGRQRKMSGVYRTPDERTGNEAAVKSVRSNDSAPELRLARAAPNPEGALTPADESR